MTSEQIAELRETLPPIARGDSVQIHRESYERAKELTLKLLDEREALLGACKAMLASAAELNAPIGPEHMGRAWYFRRQELEKREHAALDAATMAIVKAEAP